jgi:hypothetical protein
LTTLLKNSFIVEKKYLVKVYLNIFLFSILMLNFIAFDNRFFIAIVFFSGVVALWMKMKVDKTIIYLWIFITTINILSNMYANIYLSIPIYKNWMVYWIFIPLVFQFVLNTTEYFGIYYILQKIKKIFYIQIVISFFAICLILFNGFSINVSILSNPFDTFILLIQAFNKNIAILYEYGMSRGYLAYFSIGLYLIIYSILSKKERRFFSIYLLMLTIILGAKAPLLGFLTVLLFFGLNFIFRSYYLKLLITHTSTIGLILLIIYFVEEINILFMADGRYLFPVFIYSDFWQHILGSGFGNYSLFAFKNILNFSADMYSPLLDNPAVQNQLENLASTVYNYNYVARNDVLYPIAESDLLFFSVQLGSGFTIVLFYWLVKIYIKNINLFFRNSRFNYQKNFFILFIFLLITSILQDYFNSVFSWIFFAFLLVFNNENKREKNEC